MPELTPAAKEYVEQWLLSNGPWGLAVSLLLAALRKVYADLQRSRDNERKALLGLLHARESDSDCENLEDS
jgi:hypothetical protein